MRTTAVRVLLVSMLLLGGCRTLRAPSLQTPKVVALPPAASGSLAEVSSLFAEDHPAGESGFLLLSANDEALRWRLALADHATTSIDAQYFIWERDEAGHLLFDRLLRAADRGVRVRLLVDDLPFAPNDHTIAVITRHPNFDIKIFNPGKYRDNPLGKMGGMLLNFKELNRRMHNKLFAVDNQLAIVGGRNIGNAYFGLSKKYNFRDLDVLTAGPVVEEISDAFDRYWNAELSYAGSAMSSDATFEELAPKRQAVAAYLAEKGSVLASYPVEPKRWEARLKSLPSRMHSGTARFLQDKPVIHEGGEYRLDDMIRNLSAPSREEVIVVTPYFIPDDKIMEGIAAMTLEGTRVKLLTGSMGANNHTAAHSHYKKYRRPVLEAGAELYEFKHHPAPAVREIVDVSPVDADFVCLHVKALVGDRRRCFVGSLNLDPRGLVINTENGLFIESAGLCGEMADEFDAMMAPENAWQVLINEGRKLRWESSSGTVSRQPARNSWQRVSDFFCGLLPIESQL